MTVHIDEHYPEAWRRADLHDLLRQALEKGQQISVRIGRRRILWPVDADGFVELPLEPMGDAS